MRLGPGAGYVPINDPFPAEHRDALQECVSIGVVTTFNLE
jgi:hypothetical protein